MSSNRNPCYLQYIGDDILPIYMGIVIGHYEVDPY